MKLVLLWLVLCFYTRLPTLSHSSTNSTLCFDSERDALLQFKHGITKDHCELLASWKHDTDCCQWNGVHCSNRTGHVIALAFPRYHPFDSYDPYCLEGKVSPSLGELKHLKVLNLSHNSFHGKIPPQLGNLSMLTTLDLRYFSIDDFIHVESLSWISRLSLLRYLDLSYSDLSKVTNWMTIVNNFRFLSVLRMDGCQLPWKIPSSFTPINSSSALHFISLSKNNFDHNSVLRWLFSFRGIDTQLEHLDVSWNSFQGPIPSEFENLRSLSYLDLSLNSFQGSIPSEFGNLRSLSYLDLSNNNLQGSIFKIITKLCNLQQLHLKANNFTDELTNVIQAIVRGENMSLTSLDLSRNRFWGTIPDSIGSFSSLRELDLGHNQLNGWVTTCIGLLSMLEVLDVSSNALEGTLTHTHFLNLSKLRDLYLSNNRKLVINIDMNWIPPFQLSVADLRSCKLGPLYPKWLQMQTKLEYLDISNAEISDKIPNSFQNSVTFGLKYLNMSYNQFYGRLPNQLNMSYNSYLSFIDLSSNLFEGSIPVALTTVHLLYLNDNRFSDSSILCPKTKSNISELRLSNNLFSGELPDCWTNFDQLYSLHLENNRFSGNIPKSLSSLKSLICLDVNNNSFSGPIPASFENFTSLGALNLGYNSFTGNVPPWIGNSLQKLGAIILRNNHFTGEIPVSICQLAHLQILHLANNNISGVIPNCISNFTAMMSNDAAELYLRSFRMGFGELDPASEEETIVVSWKGEEQIFKQTVRFLKSIDLSNNKLSGEIPNEISILSGLISLDLSENNLSGSIPLEIGNLTNLEFLDFSHNHLTGDIPMSLAKVSSLGTLDVSNNNLSGEIPISTQLQSFNPSSYMGNHGLCGAPLPMCPKNVPHKDKVVVESEYDFDFYLGLYISVVLGFIVGFWGVCGTLVIKR